MLFIKYLIGIYLLAGFTPINAQDELDNKLVTIVVQQTQLRNVIDKISSQANVYFIFDDILVRNKKITCSFNAESVHTVISYIADQMDLFFKFINNNTVVFYKDIKNNYSDVSLKGDRVNDKLWMRKGILSPPERKINQLPDYPALAKQKNIEGNVNLNLLISRTGGVERVQVIKSSGHEILDRAAIDYSKQIIFEPAKKGDSTIATWYSMSFNYKLFQSDISPNNYINGILNYYTELEDVSEEKSKNLFYKIFDTHIHYLTRFNNEDVNVNYYLDKIISPSLKDEWEDFWEEKSFDFLVFHDFIQRSSYEELNNQAKSYLVKFLLKELDNKDDLSPIKQELFKENVYTFLEKNYPKIMNKVFREEVEVNKF